MVNLSQLPSPNEGLAYMAPEFILFLQTSSSWVKVKLYTEILHPVFSRFLGCS